MKSTVLLLSSTLVLTSCFSPPDVSDTSAINYPGFVNEDAPYLWENKSFPKTVRISTNFTDDEVAAITSMSTAWKTAVDDKKTFFTYGDKVTNKTNNIDPDKLYDKLFGIYKTTVWPQEIDGGALAVTQIFGRRYNLGQPDEFVGIVEADIMVNYDDFTFDSTPDGSGSGYDLATVMLHEMGHFLGLQHISEWDDRDTSVMYPSIHSSEVKRIPQQLDIDVLADKYNIDLGGSSGTYGIVAQRKTYTIKENDPGEDVRILIELRADGECVHKVNGAVIGRHSVKLK